MRDDKEPGGGVVLAKHVVVLFVLLYLAPARQFAEVVVLRARKEGNVVGSEVLQQSLFWAADWEREEKGRVDGGSMGGGGAMIDDDPAIVLVWW